MNLKQARRLRQEAGYKRKTDSEVIYVRDGHNNDLIISPTTAKGRYKTLKKEYKA